MDKHEHIKSFDNLSLESINELFVKYKDAKTLFQTQYSFMTPIQIMPMIDMNSDCCEDYWNSE